MKLFVLSNSLSDARILLVL